MKTISCFSALFLVFFYGLFLSAQAQTSFNISNKSTGDTLFTIDTDGDVGIGTTTPAVKFDLRSSITDDHGRLWLANSDLSHFLRFFSGRQNSPNPGIFWNETDALRFGTSLSGFTEYMRIANGGNIGIGTTNPLTKLQINGALSISDTVGLPDQTNYNLYMTGNYDNGVDIGKIYVGDNTGWKFHFASRTGGSDTDLITIRDNGNVGIGVADPVEMLQVADTIYSTVGGFKFPDGSVQSSAAGTGGSAGNTLDAAYDQGGAGNGRTIIADAGAFEVEGIDGALFTGTFNSGVIPVEGAGTRMMWYPAKAAFRAGHVSGTFWDNDSIGQYSFAAGLETKADALNATALGSNTTASGQNSTALGFNTTASGAVSAALGSNTQATGNAATAMGWSTQATGAASTAFGFGTSAEAQYSTAMGWNTQATGSASTATGYLTVADHTASTALGWGTQASGAISTAIGQGIEAQGSHSVAIALSDQTGQQIIRDSVMAIMGGKVGIGTVDPSAKLEIKGEIDEYPLVLTSNNAPFNSTPFLLFQRPGNYELLSISSDDPSNLFLGLNTGINNAPSGDYGVNNVFIGLYSGYLNTSGNYNTAVGTASLVSNSTGAGNTAIGTEALTANTTGFNNTAIGVAALRNNSTGNMNSALGGRALRRNTTGQGNVGIGWEANYYNEEGSNNTLIGHRAGGVQVTHNKNGNVFVGYEAGYNETGNNNLYIENSRSSTPLIYGQFDNDFITVNGGLAATDTFGLGIIPVEGAGTRLMWYPGKAAFRSGRVSGSQWDDSDIGNYSTAMGYNTVASGGEGTVAMGYNSVARGNGSLVAGFSNIVNDSYSVAAGRFCTTDEAHSTAWGSHAKAHHTASMVFAANSSGVLSDSVYTGGAEQMVFRADGGTYFTNSGGAAPYNTSRLINTSTGAYLSSGGTWTNSSSRDFKENISDLPLSQAIEAVKQLNPVTYNYKAEQDENYVGFIAEDVPELAATKDRKGLSPMDIVAVLTKVVQDQQARIERLEQEINKMEKSR